MNTGERRKKIMGTKIRKGPSSNCNAPYTTFAVWHPFLLPVLTSGTCIMSHITFIIKQILLALTLATYFATYSAITIKRL